MKKTALLMVLTAFALIGCGNYTGDTIDSHETTDSHNVTTTDSHDDSHNVTSNQATDTNTTEDANKTENNTTTEPKTDLKEGLTLDCTKVKADGGVMSFTFITKIDREYVVNYSDEEVSPTIEHYGEFIVISDEKTLNANTLGEILIRTVSVDYYKQDSDNEPYLVLVSHGFCYQDYIDDNTTNQ